MIALLLAWGASAAAYSTLLAPAQPRSATASPFLGTGLATHATGHPAADQCPADLPSVFDVAAPPRALPKKATPGGNDKDPLGLWAPPSGPRGPTGPSVYKLNQGRAIDMLRQDYPRFFVAKPDLSIFTKDVELHDPTGRRLRGLNSYEKLFDMLRFLRRTTMQDAQVTYRLVVSDDRIRVRWTAKLWMRDPALGLTKMANGEPAVVHLDGVSNYDLDDEGKVYRHTLENIVLRGSEQAEPVQLALAWPSMAPTPELAMPVGYGFPLLRPLDGAKGWAPPSSLAALFEPPAARTVNLEQPSPQLLLPLTVAAQPARRRGGAPRASAEPPLEETPMQRAARERAEDAEKARQLAEMRAPKAEQKGLFGMSVPQPCDTSYDCERPEVCCDLLFTSVCCSAGLMIPTIDAQPALQRQAIPIPVEPDNGLPNLPRGNSPPSY